MKENQFSNKKQFWTFLILLFSFCLLSQDKFRVILAMVIFITFLFWTKEIITSFKCLWVKYKQIRQRKFFYITDNLYVTDLKQRREFWNKLLEQFLYIFFGLVFPVIIIGNSLPKQFLLLNFSVVYIFSGVVLFLFCLLIRYYWISFYYYIIPIFTVFLFIESLDKFDEIQFIFKYLGLVTFIYFLFMLLIPLPYLRKVNDSTLVSGVILSIALPLLFEHVIESYVSSQVIHETITITDIQKAGFSKNIVSIFKEDGVLDIFNQIYKLLTPIIVDNELKFLSTISFLCISGYSIGNIIISSKLKLGDLKANDIFLTLNEDYQTNDCYSLLRDCVFYGGEKYEFRIMGNQQYSKIVRDIEKREEFLFEDKWWYVFPRIIYTGVLSILKKLI